MIRVSIILLFAVVLVTCGSLMNPHKWFQILPWWLLCFIAGYGTDGIADAIIDEIQSRQQPEPIAFRKQKA